MDTKHRFSFRLLVALVLAGAAAAVSAQSFPIVDGTVNAGEYSFAKTDGPMRLFASFDAKRIYLAVEGRTTGWVAVGLGSLHMNGAAIFMGYATGERQSFTAQEGRGHGHRDTGTQAVLEHAVAERAGQTTMELVLDRSTYLEAGSGALDVIYAEGDSDSFVLYHAFRSSAAVPVS